MKLIISILSLFRGKGSREHIIPILNSWTKSDNVVRCTRASKCAVLIIISIAISLRTLLLKELRVDSEAYQIEKRRPK